MMTQQLGFSVLTAPIAAIDRRSLSQAWYSALHLAHAAPHNDASKTACALTPHAKQSRTAPPERSGTSTGMDVSAAVHPSANRSRTDVTTVDRRSLRSPLARKIEHLFLRPNLRATRATFTIDGTTTRVHVSMQQTRSGLRLVAICPARARESVARALEQARYALAARGIAFTPEVVE